MTVSASGAEQSTITADEDKVTIERGGIFASLRQGRTSVTFLRDVTGVHVDSPKLGFRGWIQILVGGESPTTWTGANQNPRCMYFNASQETDVRAVAQFIQDRLTPVRPVPGISGLDSTGAVVGDPPKGDGGRRTDRPVILVITSNPQLPQGPAAPGVMRPKLDLDDELNRIRDALEGSRAGREFDLETRPASRVDDLVGDLLEYPPTILHFSGHGLVAGLILTGADGKQPVLANPVALAYMLQLEGVKANIRALVLNVCVSIEQAQFLAQWAPVVVGTTDLVPDAVAIEFAHGFYAGVGNNASARECFAAGVAAASLVDPAGAALYTVASAADPAAVRFE